MGALRALIITYYWPPAGGGGVQRWVKHTKYLREFGVEPVIFTPQDPDYPAVDESLLEEVPEDLEVVRCPIWEPYDLYRKFTGKKSDQKIYSGFIDESGGKSLKQRASVFIRGNFFIPDARKFWIKPSVRFLSKYLKNNPVDVIISTGPPHSMHLIGLGVKRKTGIAWIADFRDPWTQIDFYDKLELTRYADRRHRRLEARVLNEADRIVTVSPSWVEDYHHLSGREIDLITNGYDPADFVDRDKLETDDCMTHIGSINEDRNPVALWEVLNECLEKNEILPDDFRLRLIGPVDGSALAAIKTQPALASRLEHIPWKDHGEVVVDMMKSGVLLLLVNMAPNSLGILPGKLYEYMGSGRPILAVGPVAGDVRKIIRASESGECADMEDKEDIRRALREIYQAPSGKDKREAYIRRFSRRYLAGKYSELISEVVGNAAEKRTT